MGTLKLVVGTCSEWTCTAGRRYQNSCTTPFDLGMTTNSNVCSLQCSQSLAVLHQAFKHIVPPKVKGRIPWVHIYILALDLSYTLPGIHLPIKLKPGSACISCTKWVRLPYGPTQRLDNAGRSPAKK